MKFLIPAILALSIALPVGAFASDDAVLTPDVQAQVRTILEAEGYEVRQIEMEDGMIEAYVMKDGTRYEIYLNAALEIERVAEDD
ncbi:MAG: PepSY domain-containing protein [Roseicyclus sp.]